MGVKTSTQADAIDGLNAADTGVRLLAGAVVDIEPARVLLVCCGDLPGLRPGAQRLVLDIRETEGSVAHCHVVGPGLSTPMGQAFDHAMVWPRAHLGKDFSRQCIARAAVSLVEGGRIWCAVRKDKGADSISAFMEALLGNVHTERREQRYRLFCSIRGRDLNATLADETLSMHYQLDDPRLEGLLVRAYPGVFSRRELDAGTRLLIDHAGELDFVPEHVVDLGAGVGPLALWAARHFGARVTAVESNAIAAASCRANAEASGLAEHIRVLLHDGLPEPGEPADLALVNPPTHADPTVLGRLLEGLRAWLRPQRPALAVVNRPGRAVQAFESAGARTRVHAYARYCIVEARWG